MLKLERLEEIEKRYQKSTPGKWQLASQMPLPGQPLYCVVVDTKSIGEISDTRWNDEGGDRCEIIDGCFVNDANFIAHAHQDVPELLDEIKRLRKIIDDALGHFEEIPMDLEKRLSDTCQKLWEAFG